MRRRSKIKKTFLSSLFIKAFFLLVGGVLEPVPVLGTLFDIVSQEI